jgi:hypothetical protein
MELIGMTAVPQASKFHRKFRVPTENEANTLKINGLCLSQHVRRPVQRYSTHHTAQFSD